MRARLSVSSIIFVVVAGWTQIAAADDVSDMQENFGQMIGDVQFAEKTCSKLHANQDLINEMEATASVDVEDASTHTEPFKAGREKATKEAQEIVDEAKADGFCEIILKAYGPDGIRTKNMIIAK